MTWAAEILSAAVLTVSGIAGADVVCMNNGEFRRTYPSAGGLADVGGTRMWLPALACKKLALRTDTSGRFLFVFAHEIGHLTGLRHANAATDCYATDNVKRAARALGSARPFRDARRARGWSACIG